MITSSLLRAETRIYDTRRFLALSEKKSDAIKHILGETNEAPTTPSADWAKEVESFTIARTYDYVCAVILLYGLFERFIEDLAEEYLDAISSRLKSFPELPEKIKQAHIKLTIAQLQRAQDHRYNGKTNQIKLAESLSAGLSGKSTADFINEPFLYHASNFRIRTIDEFLGQLGISQASRRAVNTQAFEEYNKNQADPKIISKDQPESVWELTNDLVERRNQVAHGDISASLAPSELYQYCDLIEAYCRALSRVARDSLAETLALSAGNLHDHPIKVFNHNIVCINSKGVELLHGSLLACKQTNGDWYSLMIKEIQIDGKPVSSSPKGEDIAVGLSTDGRCKEEHIIFSIT